MTRFEGRYYLDVTGEVAMTVLLLRLWTTAFSSGVFTATALAGVGWDDESARSWSL